MISILGIVGIFFAKVIEVTLTTMRMVYVNKGERLYASMIGFVEILIWLKVASNVLIGINDNPAKMFSYALGFAAGSYVGMKIEEKIGLGYTKVEIITTKEVGMILADEIRKLGKAVTISDAEGRDGEKIVLTTFLRRKTKEIVLSKVREMNVEGVVSVSEIQKVYGGFGLK